MGNTVRDQVEPEKDGEAIMGQNNPMPTNNNKYLEDQHFREIWGLKVGRPEGIQAVLGADKLRTPRLILNQILKEETDLEMTILNLTSIE